MGSPAVPPAAYVTPDEYLQLERKAEFRSEYLDGTIVAMAGGSREHSLIASSLLAEVFLQLKGKTCETHGSDLRIWMPAVRTFAYSDMLVICGEPRFRSQEPDTVENPTLIAEVLSNSTAEYVRTQKFRHYRSIPELRQYVILSQDKPQVEVFTLREGFWVFKDYASIGETVELDAIGVNVPMSAIYARLLWVRPHA